MICRKALISKDELVKRCDLIGRVYLKIFLNYLVIYINSIYKTLSCVFQDPSGSTIPRVVARTS
jgi:hypothetical protein